MTQEISTDALLVGLCREVMEDLIGTRLVLTEAQARGITSGAVLPSEEKPPVPAPPQS